MTTLSNQVNNGPVIFSLLEMIHTEVDEFGSPQSATEQDRQHRTVALPSNLFYVWCVQERLSLVCGKPISPLERPPSCSFDSTNTSRQLWAKESYVGCFVRETANGSQPEVNRGQSQMAALEFQSISENNGLTEGEPGLGAVPCDEIINRESIGPA